MTVASGLVDGAGAAGAVAALALAQAGLEVTFVAGGASAEGSLDVAAALGALGEGGAAPAVLEERLRESGVEVRPETHLVGSVVIDRHVEVELSDGRVENHDMVVVVVGGDRPWRVLVSGSAPHPAAVDDAVTALAALAAEG